MKTGLIGFAVRLPAAVAIFALLVVTTAAVTPGLFHGDDLDHCCEFCHLGHLPLLKPARASLIRGRRAWLSHSGSKQLGSRAIPLRASATHAVLPPRLSSSNLKGPLKVRWPLS